MAVLVGLNGIIFGIQEPKPLVGFPEGKIRLRLRNEKFALARVRDAKGVREFLIREKDGAWTPFLESGRNITPMRGTPHSHPCEQ